MQVHFFNGGALTEVSNSNRLVGIVAELESAMHAEAARWGDTREEPPRNVMDDWLPVVDRKLDVYFPQRNNIVLSQLRALDLFPDVAAPEFSQHGRASACGVRPEYD